MDVAVARHDHLLLEQVGSHGGYVFATGGDGFAVAFSTAGDALAAVAAIQDAFAAESWPDETQISVRFGVHTCEAQERNGDYFGRGVNRAARLMGAASGGQVLLSDVTVGLVPDVDVVDLGPHRFRGIGEPMSVFQLGSDSFPALRTESVGTRGLPSPRSSFVGRADDLASIGEALASSRLVTLTGVGGVGKTRLGLEVAREAASRFVDGVQFCELAPVGDGALVVSAVAAALGVKAQREMTLAESVVDALVSRELLLVLDNCEHVLGAAGDLVEMVLDGTDGLAIMTTSREPLGVAGERVWPVRSLDLASEAVDLFMARASEADLGFTLPPGGLEGVERICRRLDGIPLAMELAAARTRSMSIGELERRLDDRLRLLRGAGRGGVERHQTLHAAVDWSYQLLTDRERLLFNRLSVFMGAFDLAAVTSVCTDDDLEEADIVELTASLVDKSMIVADRTADTTRFTLLETLRQYGEERLIESGDAAHRHDRHLDTYISRAQEHQSEFEGPDWEAGLEMFDLDWDQLRAAAAWPVSARDVDRVSELIGTLPYILIWTARREVALWVDDLPDEAPFSTAARDTLAMQAISEGDHLSAASNARAGIAAVTSETDVNAEAGCWHALAIAMIPIADNDEGRAEAFKTMTHAYELPGKSAFRTAITTIAISVPPISALAPDEAAPHRERAMEIADDLNHAPLRAFIGQLIGESVLFEGHPESAEAILERSLAIANDAGVYMPIANGFRALAGARGALNRPETESTYQEALAYSWHHHDWATCLWVLESYGTWLANTDRRHDAALILNYLAHHQGFLYARADQTRQALNELRSDPETQTALARSENITRSDLIQHLLAPQTS